MLKCKQIMVMLATNAVSERRVPALRTVKIYLRATLSQLLYFLNYSRSKVFAFDHNLPIY